MFHWFYQTNKGRCRPWGDPHVITFDGNNNDVYGVAWYQLSAATDVALDRIKLFHDWLSLTDRYKERFEERWLYRI